MRYQQLIYSLSIVQSTICVEINTQTALIEAYMYDLKRTLLDHDY